MDTNALRAHQLRAHHRLTESLAAVLEREAPRPSESFPCPYLPGRSARHVTILPPPVGPGVYHSFMDLNFRRLGTMFYRPACDACRECRAIRIPVAEFQPSRAQLRCWRRNTDLVANAGALTPIPENHHLYARYLAARHDGKMDGSPEEFLLFLHTSSVKTEEISFRLGGRLVAAVVVDVEPLAMSAVYSYYDPELSSRSLGTFAVLFLIEECRRRGLPYLYLGYYVRDCGRMSYKARFRPSEIRDASGRWVRGERDASASCR